MKLFYLILLVLVVSCKKADNVETPEVEEPNVEQPNVDDPTDTDTSIGTESFQSNSNVFDFNSTVCETYQIYKQVTPIVDDAYPDARTELGFYRYSKIETDNLAPKSAIIFFHGGGWVNGSYTMFSSQAKYFAEHDIACFLAEYRLYNTDGTIPRIALEDAKSCVRYIRENAEALNINPDQIITAGASAGGHLATAVNLCDEIYDTTDNLAVSCGSIAQLLFNPVVHNGPDYGENNEIEGYGYYEEDNYGYGSVAEYWEQFSPMNNVKEGVPPTLFLLGDSDKLIPVAVADEFQRLIQEVGGVCEVRIYEGQEHSFFAHDNQTKDAEYFAITLREAHLFLQDLGILDCDPTIEEYMEKYLSAYTY